MEEFETPQEEISYLYWLVDYFESNAKQIAGMYVALRSSVTSTGVMATAVETIAEIEEAEKAERGLDYFKPLKSWLSISATAVNKQYKEEIGVKEGMNLRQVLQALEEANVR